MQTKNKKLIKLLGILDILDGEKITEDKPKTDDDVTYYYETDGVSEEYRVLADSISEEEVDLLIKAEQLKNIKSIQKMVKFFTVLTIVELVAAAIGAVILLSQMC